MRALLLLLLVSPAVAQTPEVIVRPIIRPMPDVFLRERSPEAVAQDAARAAMILCTRRARIDPTTFDSGECAAAKIGWEAEVKRNEALQAGHK
jgi:hypothetical protein